ncbi:TPA: hypothetical protein O1406_002456 [Staphylococcus aureus]|uniref:hypothetical protein n=1 Tax=Staphylococcus TaxID=1279 RepID=UPI00044B3179|nr:MULTISPECIES: hypothetical protein [Staphylococcus]EZW50439.1 hypothetical protein U970_02492 [Staphylococcus aureus 56824-10]GBY66394.1 hypothetical protein M6K074_2798 [Staphylococcus aureus]GBY66415.1 hypothetical protein M6K074_2819 [Staphylococcus aureus]HCY7075094.1 hypothetical protein [Staphylococcus aureus]HDE8062643.1 hypothetical protein [Staphylococcus aureus]
MKRQERYSRKEKNRPLSKDIIKIGIGISSVLGFATGFINFIDTLIKFIKHLIH